MLTPPNDLAAEQAVLGAVLIDAAQSVRTIEAVKIIITDPTMFYADEHRARTGRFPHADSGPVVANTNETWRNLDQALRLGLRGLPGKDTLACLFQRERGHRHLHRLGQRHCLQPRRPVPGDRRR